jgi:hypothetical protein
MDSVSWKDTVYQRILDEETLGLENRLKSNPGLTKREIEGQLKHLYILESTELGGRGDGVGEAQLQATIAAYEGFLARWKNDENEARNTKESH